MKLHRIASLLTVILFVQVLCAENGMNSPYTRYGFGQLATMEVGANKGMGGTGIGVRNNSQINMLNPASYVAVDTLTFLLDIGVSLHNTNFAEGNVKMNARNSTFDYLAMQFRLMPRLGMTIGLMPFSNIGYNFSNNQVIRDDEDGQITTTNRYHGDGGLRQATVGIGWEPFKGLSVGTNMGYLYGEIYHYVYNQYSDASINTYTRQYLADITTYNVDFGLQYQTAFGKNKLTLGATYRLGHAIDDDAYIIDITTSSDTISRSRMSIPASYGAGISYTFDDRLTFAADYSIQQYGSTEFFGYKGADYHRASLGFEYVPEHLTRKLFRRARYRAGLHYATSHYYIGKHRGPSEYGVSVGIGLPIMNGWNAKSIINISGQAVHVRPNAPGMITENYLRLNIGLSFNEAWFDKWKVK
ncbi:MAG: hypothetical protein J6C18_03235 [Bacteroidaceae bacterium]|nr:hypothetical protein [Bacteroidaceae bacterium]